MITRVSASLVSSEKRNLIGVQLSKGKEWIRLPSIIYAVSMISGVIMILSEEAFGQYRTPHLALVIAANASWIIFPLIILFRMGLNEHPFTRDAAYVQASETGVQA
jgi:hypothetical protein